LIKFLHIPKNVLSEKEEKEGLTDTKRKTFIEFYNLLTYSVIRTDGERESDLYELNFHVDGALKEDKQEINLSQVIYGNKKGGVRKSEVTVVAELDSPVYSLLLISFRI
jgi:hypothetical protein